MKEKSITKVQIYSTVSALVLQIIYVFSDTDLNIQATLLGLFLINFCFQYYFSKITPKTNTFTRLLNMIITLLLSALF